jgi:O-acetylserine/cysteine efflux transporter
VVTKLGLESFLPPHLAAIRLLAAALPIFFLPRSAISLLCLIGIGLFLFTGQFLLLFFGIAQGMPPGLASLTMQTQAFFTIGIAALALHDATARQNARVGVAFVGLVLIGQTAGSDLTYLGLGLTLAGAMSWAIDNMLVKHLGLVDNGPPLLAAMAGAS